MNLHFADLGSWRGRVTRSTYFMMGCSGVALKYLVDFCVAKFVFHRQLNYIDYLQPLGGSARLRFLSLAETHWLTALSLTALPFIYIGLTMTVRRLRDMALPTWLSVLFFVPIGNLFFLLALSVWPSVDNSVIDSRSQGIDEMDRIDGPSHRSWVSAAVAVGVIGVLGAGATNLMTEMLGSYGWSLFFIIPFSMGLCASLVYGYRESRSLSESVGIAILPDLIVGASLLAVAKEGLICLLMAAPIALFLSGLGGALGHAVNESRWLVRSERAVPRASLCVAMLLLPLSGAIEHFAHAAPPLYRVQSSIEIAAPPSEVWQKVIAFSQIPPPDEMIFRAGIAYPIRAEITGHGVGAVRRCMFSTGPFVEPIQVWDEPKLLRFGVTENPAPLNEMSPYGNIQPPHLHGYFVSRQGQFLLTELPGGHTRLEGTTWYTDAIWPAAYWRLWSDYIIHRIHMRVLEHIKTEVELSPTRQKNVAD